MLLFLSDPFLHVSANCSKLLLALGVVAVFILLRGPARDREYGKEAGNCIDKAGGGITFKQGPLHDLLISSSLSLASWQPWSGEKPAGIQDQPSMLWASLLCFAKEEKTIRRPNRSLHHQ